jgi:hypothetical protein
MGQSKPPTPQGISALLRKAGFERSIAWKSGQIRNMTQRTDGYIVTAHVHLTGAVTVEHRGRDLSEEQQHAVISAYAAAIRAKGWQVTEETTFTGTLRLKVSAPESAEG